MIKYKDYCFMKKEEYEKLIKAYMKAVDAMTRAGAAFDEATKAMIEWSKAMQSAQENKDEIQVEK